MIDLTELPLRQASPYLVDPGGVLRGALGGVAQRIDRLGMRHGFAFQTPVMAAEPDARLWSLRLERAKASSALCAIVEPDLVLNHGEGTPKVRRSRIDAVTLPVGSASGGLIIPEGKWVSHIHDGRRYVYRTTAAVTVEDDGDIDLPIFPMLRSDITVDDVVEIAEPKVQGMLSGDFGWSLDVERFVQFGFTVEEDE